MTATGDLDPSLKFWHFGGAKVVYCPTSAAEKVRYRLGDLAEVCDFGEAVDVSAMLHDLGARGIRTLMVEGGGTIHTQFLQAGLVDEIHLAVSPFFLGDPTAPKFVNSGAFPDGPLRRMRLTEVSMIGDIALLRYMPARGQTAQAPIDHEQGHGRDETRVTCDPVANSPSRYKAEEDDANESDKPSCRRLARLVQAPLV